MSSVSDSYGTSMTSTSGASPLPPEQIEAYALPTKPRKASDRRAQHITGTVEAEAMPAGTMRTLLRDEIEALLPEDALAVAKSS
jgi:hypothetical protein